MSERDPGVPAVPPVRIRPSGGAPLGELGGLAGFVGVLIAALALRELASLLVPILFGLFLALVAWPLVGRFERRGLGHRTALTATIGVVLVVVLVGTGILALSIAELVVLVPRYEGRLATLTAELTALLARFGIEADPSALPGVISPGALASAAQSVASAISRAAATVFILAATLVFALLGGASLGRRAAVAFGERHALLLLVERFGFDLRRYLVVRAQLGLFAALLAFLVFWFAGVPLPALWGFLILAAAFIPNIGTIVALVPPTLLALLDGGLVAAGTVVVGVLLVNFAQDYLLQPRLMGTELNLTPLVVFLSIVGWAWILGPAGALLAVPLTVGLVALLEGTEATRPLAMLLRNELDEPAGIGSPGLDGSAGAGG